MNSLSSLLPLGVASTGPRGTFASIAPLLFSSAGVQRDGSHAGWTDGDLLLARAGPTDHLAEIA